jgi:hypothetical protein
VTAFDGDQGTTTSEIVKIQTDINGHTQHQVYLYIIPKIDDHEIIMGLAWMKDQEVTIHAKEEYLEIGPRRLRVESSTKDIVGSSLTQISGVGFHAWSRRTRKDDRVKIFSASLADINKALQRKICTDPKTKLPSQYREFWALFDQSQADKLPPLRPGADHQIQLEQENGKEAEVPWGPLYNMSREELLVLRKTLTELLDKNFIRVSNSPAAAPVLFVKKPGGGLRFCVDYRGLNKVTRKDRYPLPLIRETLHNLGKAKWFTKLDVVAAFHKIRVQKGDEWKTAFRTRYGLFEWLVTPFGLANAPSTFQRYINWALKDYLDEFCSAYVDDILIYTDGTKEDHEAHVKKVLTKLQQAGLQLDIDKCEFGVTKTKYLGFIIEANKGIQMDPAKVEAIVGWEAPGSVKATQSFLGFANFYRQFIEGYSAIAAPLTTLTKKDQAFQWTEEAETAFTRLKELFIKAPVLSQFDSERRTILETDASGWSIGGALMQFDDDGILRPCAFYSKKNAPAECNYEIYDKEMLAIIRCLEEWDGELRSVKEFEIRTDHKNLEYFMTAKKLTERQMRWSLILSRYNFIISYIPGKQNERADALSRREQDSPKGAEDDRLQHRMVQLLKPETIRKLKGSTMVASAKSSHHKPVQLAEQEQQPLVEPLQRTEEAMEAMPLAEEELLAGDEMPTEDETLWTQGKDQDITYRGIIDSITQQRRTFPMDLGLKVSIGECSLSANNEPLFRERRWVPNWEPLRTKIIQKTHDSLSTGHPGREGLLSLLARQFFWPGMAGDVRQFVRNCDGCKGNKAWRERRSGFLKPLPIPSRIWQEISIDFITDLPKSHGCTNLMVITDRLSKGVILEPCSDIRAETVAKKFIQVFYRHHGIPRAIVSDRGVQFVGQLWKRVCTLLQITRRLSTAYHPETDGSTERMNQTVEAYIRIFTNYDQDNWVDLLSYAELAINNRDATATKVSPFFLMHGYHVEPVTFTDDEPTATTTQSPIQQADSIIYKLKQATDWAQAAMAVAQQSQEEAANRTRQQAPAFKVGDKVWLDLRNIRTKRPCKKLDTKYAKFTITERISSHSYRLDTPPGIHNVFHVALLQLAATDPLPSQAQTDSQPPPQLVDGEEEWELEAILREKYVRRGRGRKKKYLVKWVGYQEPTWEPAAALGGTAVLETWERRLPEGGGTVTG